MTTRQKMTPPALAKLWGVSVDKIIAFIRRGELRAIDSSSDRGSPRPRFLIDHKDIEAFELARAVAPPAPKTRRRRRRRNDPAVREYF